MPSNNRSQPKAERRTALIEAARELLVRDGYDMTTMAKIAAAAGATPNTLYWYFKDKDELLVAVLDVLQQEYLQAYEAEAAMIAAADKLVWMVEWLRPIQGLVATIHNRIKSSPPLDAWHDAFHAEVELLLYAEFPSDWPAELRKAEARVVAFTLEGLVMHNVKPENTEATCRSLARRWSASGVQELP